MALVMYIVGAVELFALAGLVSWMYALRDEVKRRQPVDTHGVVVAGLGVQQVPSPLPPPAPPRARIGDIVGLYDSLRDMFNDLGSLRTELGNVTRRVTEQGEREEHPPFVMPPITPAPPVIDTKSLLELIHAQQLSMVTMVASVVKDISQHAAATITAPLINQMNRPQPPQGPMTTPQPWYGREDVAVIDGDDPFERFMPPSPYNHTGQPSAGYVVEGHNDDNPFGIDGLKWPQGFQQGMVRPQSQEQ